MKRGPYWGEVLGRYYAAGMWWDRRDRCFYAEVYQDKKYIETMVDFCVEGLVGKIDRLFGRSYSDFTEDSLEPPERNAHVKL